VLLTKWNWWAKQKKTKTGLSICDHEEVLSYLANENPIVKDILEWRQMKLQSTYIDALLIK
jgi:DNA polymerase-1